MLQLPGCFSLHMHHVVFCHQQTEPCTYKLIKLHLDMRIYQQICLSAGIYVWGAWCAGVSGVYRRRSWSNGGCYMTIQQECVCVSNRWCTCCCWFHDTLVSTSSTCWLWLQWEMCASCWVAKVCCRIVQLILAWVHALQIGNSNIAIFAGQLDSLSNQNGTRPSIRAVCVTLSTKYSWEVVDKALNLNGCCR